MRSSLQSLLRRPVGINVHNLLPADAEQPPLFVLNYLNKGCKFIPDRFKHSWNSLQHSIRHLERRLHIDALFQSIPKQPNSIDYSRCTTPSTWEPPPNPDVDRFVRLLKRDLSDYEPRSPSRNMSTLGKRAEKWLKERSSSIVIVDCDKGLGDAVMSRAEVDRITLLSLEEDFRRCSEAEYRARTARAQMRMDLLLMQAERHGTLPARVLSFLREKLGSLRAGRFRIRVKLHKTPYAGDQ
mmetsp:Transcript_99804/g.321797  ORF Transcript_99804/g.321797 Transcript_99804/m.321797 type:complete len:240 (+) Transcript_99804:149-868(+)